jgi:hypothetical protein
MDELFLYLRLGFKHIIDLGGVDHIVFVLALTLRYIWSDWKKILILVTAFTIGHSLTLALSTLSLIDIPVNWIEFLIPVTILITAVSNFWVQDFEFKQRYSAHYGLALFFGLIHGLGFYSGTLSYVSIRYGGQLVGANVELNGLALGGVGRETIIDHIDLINGLDDGIEIWGGTVNIKYVNIWNSGDDSLDIDQGWRGKIQFGFIVQGYCKAGAASGSGFSDNAIELDGAERSDYQPVTTGVLYNLTVVGNPGTGSGSNGSDHATAWRDNCNMQIRQSVFTGLGEAFIRSENPSDGSGGYGAFSTLGWAARWSTSFNYMLGSSGGAGPNAPASPINFYKAQTNGNLCEIKDSIVHNFPNTALSNSGNLFGTLPAGAMSEANALGVFAAGNANVQATALPMVSLVRGTTIPVGTLAVTPVASIDPRAAGDAVTAAGVAPAPSDGFFTPTSYRGAFSSTQVWTCDWTAADNYGFISTPDASCLVSIPCPADLNGDSAVGASDLATLLAAWGGTGSADINGNGTVGAEDLAALLAGWGNCP